MSTFVLVHGAWHGGWCWDRLAEPLRSAGHEVHTPTLTGLGEQAALATPGVNLETHVHDVTTLLRSRELDEVVLVGHSYAGLVVSMVADRESRRISRLVYLDAVVPENGQSLLDCASADFRAYIDEHVRVLGEGWLIPVQAATAEILGLHHQADRDWVMPRLTPHPARTFREPMLVSTIPAMPRSYINCIGEQPPGQPRSTQAQGIDDYHELRSGHDAMVTAPHALARLLSALA